MLEIAIGLYALGFPSLVAGVTPIYLEVWRAMQPGPVLFGAIQFALVGSTLLLPTAAMGATLPLLARFSVRHLTSAGARVGTLYAVNTVRRRGRHVARWLRPAASLGAFSHHAARHLRQPSRSGSAPWP